MTHGTESNTARLAWVLPAASMALHTMRSGPAEGACVGWAQALLG